MASTQNICPKCGAPFRDSEGLCPRCLLRGVVAGPGVEPMEDNESGRQHDATVLLGRLGDYELLERIAQGGMGVVYKARQVSLNRLVALKVILAGPLATESERRRFRTEAESAAQLDHPNIIPIFEIGEEAGRPFFAMKLVEGGSLEELRNADCGLRIESGKEQSQRTERAPSFNPQSALRIPQFIKVALALHHAHQRGVLHRDLKPANILLDAQGEPHIADFGLARLTQHDSGLTLPGTVMGTPAFMAPEQAAGAVKEMTTATDIYGAGAVLYFLLTGCAPFRGANAAETLRLVLEEEPVRPGALHKTDRDLETICLKCLEKNPARRYASALDLAQDLQRWQRHEPIQARAATSWELAGKWVRRRPASAALIGVSVLSILLLIGLQAAHRRRLEGERNRALAQAETTRQNLYAADIFLADEALTSGQLGLARRSLENHLPAAGQRDLRGFEWHYLWSRCQGEQTAILPMPKSATRVVAFSPDGQLLAAASEDRLIHIWDLSTHALRQSLLQSNDVVVALEFSRDGHRLVAGTESSGATLWDLDTSSKLAGSGTNSAQVSVGGAAELAAISLDTFPATGRESIVILHEARNGTVRGVLRRAGGAMAISHDGRLLAAAAPRGFVLWDAATLQPVRTFAEAGEGAAFYFSPDDHRLAVLSAHGRSVSIWDLESGVKRGEISVEGTRLHAAAFSPDGQRLATCGTDQRIHLWDLTRQIKLGELKGHLNEVRSVAFSPDGHWLASGSKDGTVRLWRAEIPSPALWPTNIFPPCALSRDGRILAAQDRPGRRTNVQVLAWTIANWQPTPVPAATGAQPIAFLDNGALLAMNRPFQEKPLWLRRYPLERSYSPRISLGDAATSPHPENPADAAVALPGSDRPRTATDYSAARDLFAMGSYDGQITIWRASGGQPLATLRGPKHEVITLRFAPDGHTLAAYTSQSGLKLWLVDEGRELRSLPFTASQANDLAFAPKDDLLAVAGSGNNIQIYQATTGLLKATLTGHAEAVIRLAFAPDGRTLASASEDGTVKLWSLSAWRELATLSRGDPKVWLEFSPDGRSLFGTGTNGHLQVWRAGGEGAVGK